MTPRGFTTLEIIIALSISITILIFGGIGIQSIRNKQLNNQGAYKLYAWLENARDLSLKTRQTISICPIDNQQKCNPNWQNPLMQFIDKNHNGLFDQNDVKLRVLQPLSKNIQYRGFPSSRYIRFSARRSVISTNGTLRANNSKIRINQLNRIASG